MAVPSLRLCNFVHALHASDHEPSFFPRVANVVSRVTEVHTTPTGDMHCCKLRSSLLQCVIETRDFLPRHDIELPTQQKDQDLAIDLPRQPHHAARIYRGLFNPRSCLDHGFVQYCKKVNIYIWKIFFFIFVILCKFYLSK